jgi:hypothetical protein
MGVNSCPCCGDRLLRHARRRGVYWFCPSCHQEMTPLMGEQVPSRLDASKLRSLHPGTLLQSPSIVSLQPDTLLQPANV